jgi:hypothetical protein
MIVLAAGFSTAAFSTSACSSESKSGPLVMSFIGWIISFLVLPSLEGLIFGGGVAGGVSGVGVTIGVPDIAFVITGVGAGGSLGVSSATTGGSFLGASVTGIEVEGFGA